MPSMVVTARSPIEPMGRRQERTGAPSKCTVHAPHCAIPHPNLVPVRPRTSRNAQSRGMSGGASTFLISPFIRRLIMRHPVKPTAWPRRQDYKAAGRNSPSIDRGTSLSARLFPTPCKDGIGGCAWSFARNHFGMIDDDVLRHLSIVELLQCRDTLNWQVRAQSGVLWAFSFACATAEPEFVYKTVA